MIEKNTQRPLTKADYFLDISDEVCPMTFVKTKLLLEKAPPGSVVDVRLQGSEPLHNVPRSVRELGHRVEFLIPEDAAGLPQGIHILRIQRT